MKINVVCEITTIKEVKKVGKCKYEIHVESGWFNIIKPPKGVVPKIGDTVESYTYQGSCIRGICLNEHTLFFKSQKKLDIEHEQFCKKFTKEKEIDWKKTMKVIAKRKPYKTVDISGMGSGYENACQEMLKAGRDYLDKHPNIDLKFKQNKDIWGIIISENKEGETFMDYLDNVIGNQSSGAMIQCVVNHLMFIRKNGYEQWLTSCRERQYMYPLELPKG